MHCMNSFSIFTKLASSHWTNTSILPYFINPVILQEKILNLSCSPKQSKREEVKVISINNEGRELNDYRIKKFGLHRCFDAFVSSCEVAMRKPDPGIFKLALGIAQVSTQECLYFDDRNYLVEAARRANIPSFQHTGFEQMKTILEQYP